ncbi:MAG: PAS domain S-box protein [Methylococcales bacterium]|nr:PAS domain S-box protein [Methylococcales bacterium]
MNTPLKILVIEDEPADFLLLKRHLQQSGLDAECLRVDTDLALYTALQSDWDVVLSDYNVPGMDFRTTLKNIQTRYPDLPIILVSGSVGEETAVELLRLGMGDFVLKDNLIRLLPAIRRSVNEAQERSALRTAEATLLKTQQAALEEQRQARLAALNLMQDALAAQSSAEAANSALRESEQRYRILFETNPHPMWVFDLQTLAFLAVNNAAVKHYGYSKEEFLAMTTKDIRLLEDVPRLLAKIDQNSDGHDVTELWRHRRKDGSLILVEISSHFIDFAGRPSKVVLAYDVTERKQMEQDLRDSEGLSRAVTENLPDAFILMDDKGKIVLWNPAAVRIFGYTADEAVGQLLHDFIVPSRLQAAFAVGFEHFSHTGEGAVVNTIRELPAIHRNGQEFPVELSLSALQLGGKWHASGVVRDITGRKQSEAQLRKLALAVEQSPENTIITDLDARIEYVNAAFLFNSGYTSEEIIGQKISLLHSTTLDETYADLWDDLRQGRTWKGELRNKRKDGTEFIEFAIISPLYQEDGSISHYVSVSEDITVKKLMDRELEQYRHHLEEEVDKRTAELRRQSHALQALIDNLPHMAWLKDKEGRFIAVNQVVANACNRTKEELLDKTDFDIWSEIEAGHYRDQDLKVMATGQPMTLEEHFDRIDDALYEVFLAPILDVDGTPLGTVGFAQDIKRQRDNEVELARHAKVAEDATRAKSTFLANMSHEIRTPMNAVIGLTYLLRQSSPTPEQIARLDKIDSASQHLLNIINDVLDLSKIEADYLELEQTDFALGPLLDHIHSLIAEQARAKRLTVEVDMGDVPLWLRGDPTRLRQAILNYAGNAVKFTEAGSIILRAKLLAEDKDGLLVRFDVQDSGIGIEEGRQMLLFDAFTQADASTTRRYGGTGLGLTITRHLAALMGGSSGVDSVLGVGSTFWLTVRLQRGHGAMPIEPQSQACNAELLLRQNHAGACLLLAEDNPVNREVAMELLRNVGLRVDTAETGRVAVDKVQTKHYDLVLMDMQMPEMDGLTATRLIREDPNNAALPILAMTANAFDEDKRACFDSGMNDFVAKPVIPAIFYNTLLHWLSNAGSGPLPQYPPAIQDTQVQPKLLEDTSPLAAIKGLDIGFGLQVVGNDEPKYQRLLRLFADTHRQDMARVQGLLALDDKQAALRLLHDLKGVSATLGATGLASLATKLEKALREDAPTTECNGLAQQCDAVLVQLVADIVGLPEPPVIATTDIKLSPEQIDQFFTALENLLLEDDSLAHRLAQDNADVLRVKLGIHYPEFIRQIEAFDYDAAVKTLRAAGRD